MFQDIKTQWISALRSGEYAQTTGRLREERGGVVCHCALGILVDLAIKTGGVGQWRYEQGDGWGGWIHEVETVDSDGPYWESSHGAPLPKVMEWAGIKYTDAEEIWLLNDAERMPFDEIADIIEEEL